MDNEYTCTAVDADDVAKLLPAINKAFLKFSQKAAGTNETLFRYTVSRLSFAHLYYIGHIMSRAAGDDEEYLRNNLNTMIEVLKEGSSDTLGLFKYDDLDGEDEE